MRPFAALDLGSGTTKLSVFARSEKGWEPLCLEERNTELRRGFEPDRRLKPGPLEATLEASEAFLKLARDLGAERLPAYATSAVRKAKNPEALLAPLAAMGIDARILPEEVEGRWNLLGVLERVGGAAPGPGPRPRASALVIDPGGDSTECTADVDGLGWQGALAASLPFGSVSLQEAHGSHADDRPIPSSVLARAEKEAWEATLSHPYFTSFLQRGLFPYIRMNAPIQRALEKVNGRAEAPHGGGGVYSRAELERLAHHAASLDKAGRAELLRGEPLGKIDRTCYGFASWLGILDAFETGAFCVEPWGIKLGAVIALNQ